MKDEIKELNEEVREEISSMLFQSANESKEQKNPSHKRSKIKPLNKNDLKRLGFIKNNR